MKTTATKLIAIVSLSAAVLVAATASACPKGGYGGSSYSSYSPVYVKKVYVEPVYTCFRPLHSFVFVLPGDTWATISQREFGSPKFFGQIASFNGIALNQQLAIGQQIRLPEIHPNGALLPSNAPPSMPLALPGQGIPQGIALAGSPNGLPVGLPGGLPGGLQNLPQNGLPTDLQNGLANVPQGSNMPQNFAGTQFGMPTGAMQSGGLPTGAMPTNGMPTNGMPMNGGSPMTTNGPSMLPQNMIGTPNANGQIAPIGMQGPMNGSAPVNGLNVSAPIGPITGGVPTANIRLVSAEPSIPSAAAGSELVLDGQRLGMAAGFVRLRLSGIALKVEVLDWSESSVKIRLPELDLTSTTKAELEVLRADGSLASKSALELKPAVTKLAQGN